MLCLLFAEQHGFVPVPRAYAVPLFHFTEAGVGSKEFLQ